MHVCSGVLGTCRTLGWICILQQIFSMVLVHREAVTATPRQTRNRYTRFEGTCSLCSLTALCTSLQGPRIAAPRRGAACP